MRFCFLLLFLFLTATAWPQPAADTLTRLQIIGTIHTGNRVFDHNDLYRTLRTLKPDIILWEDSEPFKKMRGVQTGSFLKVIQVPIEQLALQKYTRSAPDCMILPFDTLIENRNAYVRTFVRKRQQMYDLLSSAEKTEKDNEILSAYEELHQEFFTGIETLTLAELNKENVVGVSRAVNYIEEEILPGLASVYCKDTALLNWFKNDVRFHQERNAYMARQVADIARRNPGKNIVIVVGLDHKYYLQDRFLTFPGIRYIPWPALE